MGDIVVTADDRSPIINLVTWLLTVFMVLVVLTKVLGGVWTTRRLSGDSVFLMFTMLLAVGQCVAVTEQVAGGLGKHERTLSEIELTKFQKAAYASQILYIATLCCAKLSIGQFLGTLARAKEVRAALGLTTIITGLWGIIAILALAFQCSLPHPWAILSSHCFNQTAFWDVIGIVDAITDFALGAIPAIIIWDLKILPAKKVSVLGAFTARWLTIPLIALRLHFISTASASSDHPFDDYQTSLTTQIGLNLSIVLTCVPSLKTFMKDVEHGLFTSDLRVAPHTGHFSSYAMSFVGSSKDRTQPSRSAKRGRLENWFSKIETFTTTFGANPEEPLSRSNSGGSNKMIIRQTKSVTVESEGINPD